MEIDYIVDCVAQRRAPAVVTALDGVTALEICEAEERSIRSGAPVKL
jgi:predicted dehydrogenase